MMIRLMYTLIVLACAGCGSQIAISGKERTEYLRSIKPYGAHWVKEGMTRESRRADLRACGSVNFENVRFTEMQIEAARLPTDPNDINAFLRLRDQLGQCMAERGYRPVGDLQYLTGCDARCMYP